MKLTIQIALGILLAGVIAWTVRIVVVAAAVRSLEETTAQATQKIEADTRRRADEQRRIAANAQAAADARRIEQLRAQKAAAESAVRAAQAEDAKAAARELAWKKYFKPSPPCEKPADWNAEVTCGNEFMRAKKAFATAHPEFL